MSYTRRWIGSGSLATLAVLSAVTISACDDADQTVAPVTLSAQEQADLVFLREEEKLARDVYAFAWDQWGHSVFRNIGLESEQTHMTAVLSVLDRYGIADPANGMAAGEFRNVELQQLYDDLTATVQQSFVDAMRVGATIEDVDIFDLQNASANTTNAVVLTLYDNLTCGSRNHMRAFVGQLGALGETYDPAYITQAQFDAIVNGTTERCGF